MMGFRGEMLRLSIRLAIFDGYAVRSAREQAPRTEPEAEARKLSAQCEARVREVLSALPKVITSAVALAPVLPVRCNAMYVESDEYEGSVYYDLSARGANPPAAFCNLRGAAARVFVELLLGGFAPTLQHEWTFGVEEAYSPPRFLKQLCICISVQ